MHIGIKAASALIAFLIFYHIPLERLKGSSHVETLYVYDMQEGSMLRSDHIKDVPPFTGHVTSSLETLGRHHETVAHKIKRDGADSESFLYSTAGMDDSTAALFRGPGYLSYPSGGDYFVWFPKLGNQVLFFDSQGKFLWTKKSSHYLQALPSGQWLIAAAGDHSRVFILHPDLKERLSAEGTIMVKYDVSEPPLSADNRQEDVEVSETLFAAFLDGDIVIMNPAVGLTKRVETGRPVKSIACGVSGELFVVQNVNQIGLDTIRLGRLEIDSPEDESRPPSAEVSWGFEVELNDNYNITLPLAVSTKRLLVMRPLGRGVGGAKMAQVTLYDLSGEPRYATEVTLDDGGSLDDWRALRMESGVAVWSSSRVLVFDETLIYDKRGDFQRVAASGDSLFLQEKSKITALQLRL